MRTIRELDSFRRFATGMAAVGGVLSTIPFGHVPGEVGLYKPYKYKAWHGLDEVGYKKVSSWPVHSSSSNATQMAKRKNPPTPPQSSRKVATTARTLRSRSAQMPRQAPYVSVPARRRTVARKSSMKSKMLRRGGKRKYKRSKGMRTSVSAGFFSKAKKTWTKWEHYSKYGVVSAREKGFECKADATNKQNSVLIGHSVLSKTYMNEVVQFALCKMLAIKLDRSFNSLSEVVSGTTAFRIEVQYRNVASGGILTHGHTFASTATWNDVRNQFETWVRNAGNAVPGIIWNSLSFFEIIPATPNQLMCKVRLDLLKAKIDLFAKSTLKIQNRTREGSIESDAVDNCPLYGKVYEGNGNFFFYKGDKSSQDYQPFVPDDNNNSFSYQIGETTSTNNEGAPIIDVAMLSTLREPPSKNMFYKVKTEGSAHLDPGMIKTSVLIYKRKMLLNTYFRLLSYNGTQERNTLEIGSFRFLILEKLLQPTGTVAQNIINCACEVDNKIGAVITCTKLTPTHYILAQNPQ